MPWTVTFDAAFREEFRALDADVRKSIAAYAVALASQGPHLGRPMADTLKGSKHPNMKELRPTVNKVEWRVVDAFDAARKAIVLAAAAKSGKSSARVYRTMIATADARFTAHQKALAVSQIRPTSQTMAEPNVAKTSGASRKPQR